MNIGTASIIAGIIAVILVGGIVLLQNASVPPTPTDTSTTTDTAGNATSTADPGTAATGTIGSPTVTGITGAEVAAHNSRISCWSIINGNVYDLTSWIPQHPGGEDKILKLCGRDGSTDFNGKHGGAPKQAGILSGFKIGVAAP